MKKSVHNKNYLYTLLAALLLVFQANAQTTDFQEIPEMVFMNPKLVSGTANKQGAVYRFSAVAKDMDCIVKLVKFSGSNVVMKTIDNNTYGWSKAFQPEFGVKTVKPNQTWWIDFQMTFVETGTNKPVTADAFQATSIDVDGDGYNVYEFVQMQNATKTQYASNSYLYGNSSAQNMPCTRKHSHDEDGEDEEDEEDEDGPDYTKVHTCTKCLGVGKLTYGPSKKLVKCTGCAGAGKVYTACGHPFLGQKVEVKGPKDNFSNIDTAGTQVMATYSYNNLSSLNFRMGGVSGSKSGGAGMRLNSLWFKSFSLGTPVTLPVKLSHFAALYERSAVNLNWGTTVEEGFSHFVLQRSTDGKEFTDIATVLSGNSSQAASYQYKDRSVPNSGTVYYRLALNDKSGEVSYSQVRVVRLEATNAAAIAITSYPNPVKDQLNVTLPAGWNNKKVTLELYTSNGVRVKAYQVRASGRPETMQIGNLSNGFYLVKASCDDQTAQQRVVKN